MIGFSKHGGRKWRNQKGTHQTIRIEITRSRCSVMLNNGVPVIVVSKSMGHAKKSTTLDIYGHLIPIMQEDAARIMDELITPVKVELGGNIALNVQN